MIYTYVPQNVCSRRITIDIDENGIINSISFVGGCNGNLQGVSRLAIGHSAEEIINLLQDIKCGSKETSCPAQLAEALKKYKTDRGD